MPYSFALVMALACAAFFHAAGEKEAGSGLWFSGPSVVVSALIMLVWHGGVLSVLLGQVGLLLGITLFRLWRDPH